MSQSARRCVLVFAGLDPSGGAGIQADIEAIGALGSHPLPVITALTVQDNDRVYAVHPVPAQLIEQQAAALLNKIDIAAIKIGIVGNCDNAQAIAAVIRALAARRPDVPVVLDPVLRSGHGDALSRDNAVDAIAPLLPLATLLTPNVPEAIALSNGERRADAQAETLLMQCPHVLIKGGHASDAELVTNRWFSHAATRSWSWPRLPGAFHGTGCTLASAIAALLANGQPVEDAIDLAQGYCHQTLESAYAIAQGQRVPNRTISLLENS